MYSIIHIYKEKYIEDVVMAMTEAGIEDTVVLNGESLGHKLMFENPIFAGFRNANLGKNEFASIIMAVADEDQIDFMIEELRVAGIDFVGEEIGKIVLLPIEKIL